MAQGLGLSHVLRGIDAMVDRHHSEIDYLLKLRSNLISVLGGGDVEPPTQPLTTLLTNEIEWARAVDDEDFDRYVQNRYSIFARKHGQATIEMSEFITHLQNARAENKSE